MIAGISSHTKLKKLAENLKQSIQDIIQNCPDKEIVNAGINTEVEVNEDGLLSIALYSGKKTEKGGVKNLFAAFYIASFYRYLGLTKDECKEILDISGINDLDTKCTDAQRNALISSIINDTEQNMKNSLENLEESTELDNQNKTQKLENFCKFFTRSIKICSTIPCKKKMSELGMIIMPSDAYKFIHSIGSGADTHDLGNYQDYQNLEYAIIEKICDKAGLSKIHVQMTYIVLEDEISLKDLINTSRDLNTALRKLELVKSSQHSTQKVHDTYQDLLEIYRSIINQEIASILKAKKLHSQFWFAQEMMKAILFCRYEISNDINLGCALDGDYIQVKAYSKDKNALELAACIKNALYCVCFTHYEEKPYQLWNKATSLDMQVQYTGATFKDAIIKACDNMTDLRQCLGCSYFDGRIAKFKQMFEMIDFGDMNANQDFLEMTFKRSKVAAFYKHCLPAFSKHANCFAQPMQKVQNDCRANVESSTSMQRRVRFVNNIPTTEKTQQCTAGYHCPASAYEMEPLISSSGQQKQSTRLTSNSHAARVGVAPLASTEDL